MVEKFSDYETGFLAQEGEFEFEITNAELTETKATKDPMWKFDCKCAAGRTTIYHTLGEKARWSFNNLIKACYNLVTPEDIQNFGPHNGGVDYMVIGQEMVGMKFMGTVTHDTYTKEVKVPQEDGTFRDDVEVKDSYKITKYSPVD